jgi:uncharacterized iron-regulated protein
MMLRIRFILLFVLAAGNLWAQSPVAYHFFRADGKPATFSQVASASSSADVVFFGEQHNNPIAHWLEWELAKAMYSKQKSLSLGMEMFETDQELVLEAYLSGFMVADTFAKRIKLWPNYETDYQPLVDWAKSLNIPVVATNAPRKLARLAFKQGVAALDSLPDSLRKLVADLPFMIPYKNESYKAMLGMAHGSDGTGGPQTQHFVDAQALKDATMAQRIHRARKKGQPFLHINGSYHSDKREGIVWFLQRLEAGLRIVTISTVEQAATDKLAVEHRKLADFILVVPEGMTKTY